MKCLCFSALVAAQIIPLALCQKIFPADFALPEAKPPFIPNKEIHREFINCHEHRRLAGGDTCPESLRKASIKQDLDK